VAIGGSAEAVNERLKDSFSDGQDLAMALRTARQALVDPENGRLDPPNMEVAGLDRTRGRRKFFRLTDEQVSALLEKPEEKPVQVPPSEDPPGT
jgi:proteasome alpha subunit